MEDGVIKMATREELRELLLDPNSGSRMDVNLGTGIDMVSHAQELSCAIGSPVR
jgi:hypothetical protein